MFLYKRCLFVFDSIFNNEKQDKKYDFLWMAVNYFYPAKVCENPLDDGQAITDMVRSEKNECKHDQEECNHAVKPQPPFLLLKMMLLFKFLLPLLL